MNSIKHIIFDFGGVLGADANSWVWKKDPEVRTQTGLLEKEIIDIFWKHWESLKVGNEDLQIFFEDIATQSKKEVSVDTLRKLYHRSITRNEDVFDIVKKLENTYRLYILANESLEGMNFKKDTFNLQEHFVEIFNSAELKLGKPDKKVFTKVLEKIDAPAKSVLFIDDQEKNVEAAQAVGIASILFKNEKQLQQELNALLKD